MLTFVSGLDKNAVIKNQVSGIPFLRTHGGSFQMQPKLFTEWTWQPANTSGWQVAIMHLVGDSDLSSPGAEWEGWFWVQGICLSKGDAFIVPKTVTYSLITTYIASY